MDEGTKQVGRKFAESYSLKPCPKDSGTPMMFAGNGSWDYYIICYTCGFQVHRNSKRSAINRWNVTTKKAQSEP